MDVEALLKPISEADPCGPDLELDAKAGLAWNDLQTKAEGQKIDGVATEPRWPDVLKLAAEMGTQWHHLQLGVILTQAACHTDGFDGFRDGLTVLKTWCVDFWDHVHPRGEDAAEQREMRPPLIEAMNHPRFLYQLSHVPLASAQGEKFGFADHEAALAVEPADQEGANQARLVTGTFGNTPTSFHQTNLASLQEALRLVQEIENVFDEKYGAGYGVTLSDLRELLGKMIALIEPLANPAEAASDADGARMSSAQGGHLTGSVMSRTNAIDAFERIIS